MRSGDFQPGEGAENDAAAGNVFACGSYGDARGRIQKYIIECLNRFYAIEAGLWGDPLSSLIIRTVIKGAIEGRPYDLSALATEFELSIATVHRKVHRCVEAGYLQTRMEGRSLRLYPTQKVQQSFNESFDEMVSALRRLYGRE